MIIVFGSLNIDLVLPVDAFPQPGETTFCDDYVWLPGGKGMNQAVGAARAGANVHMVGAIGADAFGATLKDALSAEKIDTAGVATVNKASGCATVMVDTNGENEILVARGANAEVRAAQLDSLNIGTDTLAVMQMEVPIAEMQIAARAIKARGGRVMLNVAPSRPFDYSICHDLDVLVLNEGEAADMAKGLGLDATTPEAIAVSLAAQYNLFCVVTLGGAGSVASLAGADILRVEAYKAGTVVDTTGAGDCYCGVLAAGLDAGLPHADAMRRASVAAGLSVLARGAQSGMPTKAAINAASI